MRKYSTVQGDTWDLILYKEYGAGAEKEMDRLIAANSKHRLVHTFSAGIVLSIPELITPYKMEPVPPWQR